MSDFWDEFKDTFKSKKKKDEEKSEKLREALEQEQSVSEQLEELEKQYQSYLDSQKEEVDLDKLFPTTLGLEKIEYTPESDESIRSRATLQNSAEKSDDVSKVENDYLANYAKLNSKKTDTDNEYAKEQQEIAELYNNLRDNQLKSGIKRGISRGSIVSSLIEGLNNDENVSKDEAQQNYLDSMDAINSEIAQLNDEKDKALEQLDLKYASELEEQIQKLTAERDKTVASYVKYNNNVDEKENAYQLQRQQDIEKYLEEQQAKQVAEEEAQREYEAKYGYSGEKLQNYSKRYQLAYDFYMSLDADIAEAALEASPNMKYYLGEYYDKLKTILANRTSDTSTRKYF